MAGILAGLAGSLAGSVLPELASTLLGALGKGAATQLGSYTMNKIVGDDPESGQLMIMEQPGPSGEQLALRNPEVYPQMNTTQHSPSLTQKELDALTTYMSSTPAEKQYLHSLMQAHSHNTSNAILPSLRPPLNQSAALEVGARMPLTILASDAAEQQEAGRGMINQRANPTQRLSAMSNLAPQALQPLSNSGSMFSNSRLGSTSLSRDLAQTIPQMRTTVDQTPQASWPMKTRANQSTVISHRVRDTSHLARVPQQAVNSKISGPNGELLTPGQIAKGSSDNSALVSDEMANHAQLQAEQLKRQQVAQLRDQNVAENVRGGMRQLGNQFINTATDRGQKYLEENAAGMVDKGINFAAEKAGGLLQRMGKAIMNKIVGDAPEGTMIQGSVPSRKIVGDNIMVNGLPPNRKIVGDGFLSMIPFIGPVLDKIVGDAPEDFASNPERDAALQVMASSVLASLYAALIRKEQLLTPDINFAFSTGPRAAAQQELDEFTPLRGSFNGSNYAYGVYSVGCMFEPFDWWIFDATSTPPAWEFLPNPSFHVSRTHVRYGYVGPPLFGNIQYNMLKPLLAGASISEFASTLRVKITTTSVDDMVHAMGNADMAVESMTGYSFSAPLARLFGYLLMLNVRPATEVSEYFISPFVRYDLTGNSGFWQPLFPTDIARRSNLAVNSRNTWDDCVLAWATAKEFIQIMNGWAANVDQDLRYDQWDSRCAVVFIRAAEMADGDTVACRILSKIQYPFRTFYRKNEWYHIGPAKNVRLVKPGQNDTSLTRIGLSQIDGPVVGVLIVVIDKWDRQIGDSVMIGHGNNALQIADDITPAAPETVIIGNIHPLVAALDSLFLSSQFGPLLMKEISIQEEILGNNSDRVSAMRWCAEHICTYRQKEMFSGFPPGSPNLVEFERPFVDEDGDSFMPLWRQKHFTTGAVAEAAMRTSWANGQSAFGMVTNLMSTDALTMNTPSNGPAPSTDSLNSTMASVEFLVWRGWLQPQEERASRPIQDAANFTSVIIEMSNIIRGITDISATWTDTDFVMAQYVKEQMNIASVGIRMTDVWFPVQRDLATVGVQIPQYHLHPEADCRYNNAPPSVYCPDHLQTVMPDRYNALGGPMPFNHIDWAILGKWAPSLLFNDPTVTLRGMDTGQRLINNAPWFEAKLRPQIVDDRWRMAHLSMHAWASDAKINPSFHWFSSDMNVQNYAFWPFVAEDATLAWTFGHSHVGNAVFLPATDTIGRPAGTFPIVRDFRMAGAPNSLVSTQPRELYNSPTGTTAVQLFVVAHGIISTMSSNLWRDYGAELYAPMTLGTLMNMI